MLGRLSGYERNRVFILRGYFRTGEGEEGMVHVPTVPFFALHKIVALAQELSKHMNLRGFFELQPWGPDY